MVQLAQQQVRDQSNLQDSSRQDERSQRLTPTRTDEGENHGNINEISFSELVSFTDVHDILTKGHDIDDSFSCYFPPNKESILTRGNLVCSGLPSGDAIPFLSEANAVQQPAIDTDIDLQNDTSFSGRSQEQNTFQAGMEAKESEDAEQNILIAELNSGERFCPSKNLCLQETCAHEFEQTDQTNDDHQDQALSDHAVPETREEIETGNTPNEVQDMEQEQEQEKGNKRKADKDSWKRNINKSKRAKGDAYMGRKYEKGTSKYEIVAKPAKALGEKCNCKTVGAQCSKLTDEMRTAVHHDVWSMSWAQREIFVKQSVHRNDVGRHRVELARHNRQNTLKYHLKVGSAVLQVCKKMFLSTTGITQHFIRAHVCESGTVNDRQPKTQVASSNRLEIQQFLTSLPAMPSHYCRKSSSKTYLEPVFNSKAEVYQAYMEWCKKKGSVIASRQVFVNEFDIGNFSIYSPRKDQCDICVSYSEGNTDEATYLLHRLRKDQAQKAKEEDKRRAAESLEKVKMVSLDMQAVLLAPSLKASALYYKTKLCVHNYTVFDCTSKEVCCYVWHEAEGGLTANEFASCISHYITQDLTYEEYIIFSDGCPYQNRNSTLSKAFTYLAQVHKKTITHKFLEKGHTQMEVDSVHHTIEVKLKNKQVYCPADYVRYIKEARQRPFPYKVEYLDHSFFKDFNNTCGLKSIRPGKKAGEPQVADIRCLQYTPDGQIRYKLVHEGDWQELQVRGNSTHIDNQPKRLLANQRKIQAAKYKHLQELKAVIPQDIHAFYDALPHE